MSGTRVLGTKVGVIAAGLGGAALPRTGFDVAWWVIVAIALIVVGLLTVRTARYTSTD